MNPRIVDHEMTIAGLEQDAGTVVPARSVAE
jgi:hypothetical protein